MKHQNRNSSQTEGASRILPFHSERASDVIIEIDSVTKQWPERKRGRPGVLALAPVTLSIMRGQFVVLLGPSGCGKSTLLRMIAGLDLPTQGIVRVAGKAVSGPGWERGMMFQDYALFPWRTVMQNVVFGLEARKVDRTERQRIGQELIELVGLNGFEDSHPNQLSGGMQQRVSLARALANDPEVLLMDEPFSAVDSQTRELLQDELLRIWKVKHKTIVFVTHDIAEAVYLADRVITMTSRPGRVQDDIRIDSPRPRDRSSQDFAVLSRRLRMELVPQNIAREDLTSNAALSDLAKV